MKSGLKPPLAGSRRRNATEWRPRHPHGFRMTTRPDTDAVTALISEAAETLILPRFRHLRPEDIEDKSSSPDRQDLVTVVDRDVEAWLTAAFARLEPGATVIGEEAVHARPGLVDLIATDRPLWIVDPIDGTKNFARGLDGFGVMVSRVRAGRTLAAWVMLPARGAMFVAEAGAGAWLNGERIQVPATGVSAAPRGLLMVRYMPPDLRAHVAQVAHAAQFDIVADSVCAAVEYTEILRGEKDFAVYYRLLPWDHAAPALILTEAGGRVDHLDGAPYGVRSDHQVTVVARSADVSARIRRELRRTR
jgi:fructose-1,6-bisphosphatase/inositol monophosphatase family enzyme